MLYHSSTADAIDNILNNGFQKITPWPGNINFLFSHEKVNYLGNFGIGTYAFLDNPKLSEFFIEKEMSFNPNKKIKTVQFKLNKVIEENNQKREVNVLNLCPNSPDLYYFQNYVKKYEGRMKRVLDNFERTHKASHIKRAGAIIEYFIYNFKLENGEKINPDAVCGTSITNNIFDICIPDGIEYCIRNIKAIDKYSVKPYNSDKDTKKKKGE